MVRATGGVAEGHEMMSFTDLQTTTLPQQDTLNPINQTIANGV